MVKDPDQQVDVSRLDELRQMTVDTGVTIGSAVTYAELRRNKTSADTVPFFVNALGEISRPQVRHNGTVGGGLWYGDPALDTPPLLLTLDAVRTGTDADGSLEIPIDEFYTGYYETAIEEGELLTEITFPTRRTGPSAGTGR